MTRLLSPCARTPRPEAPTHWHPQAFAWPDGAHGAFCPHCGKLLYRRDLPDFSHMSAVECMDGRIGLMAPPPRRA